MPVKPPSYAREVLQKLEKSGYRAYFVGGCVRDTLLQRRPQDWDVCTQAKPEETEGCFRRTIPTGKQHGTITVLHRGKCIEVTTFRADGDYRDHRRPEQVTFVPDLKEDLRRRDFTMNAIAMDLRGELFDPFQGKKDIRDRIIRAVGDPVRRFEEDALRMLRAYRFSAKLGFSIESKTKKAIEKCARLCASLAPERVHAELEGILCSAHPEILSEALHDGLLDAYLMRSKPHIELEKLLQLPRNRAARWAGLCALLEKNGLIVGTEAFLRALRLDADTIRRCVLGIDAALQGIPIDRVGLKRLVSALGEESAYCAACAAEALGTKGTVKRLREVLHSGECCSMRQLAVNGDDLQKLDFRGKEVGTCLRRLLEVVLMEPDKNSREALLALAAAFKQK